MSKAPANRYICHSCVKEKYLSRKIESEGQEEDCDYCDELETTCISISELADEIERAFEGHYERTPTEPDEFEYALKIDWERRGDEVRYVIADAAGIEEQAADDVLELLAESNYNHEDAKMGMETPFDRDSYYAEQSPDCYEYERKWIDFETHIKGESRYFSKFSRDILSDLFEDIEHLRTKLGVPVVREIGTGHEITSLYRARVFQSNDAPLEEALVHPWKGLGPPPSIAATAGRMNARGISVFYGATTPETAIAEVRPPVGSRVAVAKFDIIRPLRMLDVRTLQEVYADGSIFDPYYLKQLQRSKFLGHLSRRITRPVMPDDEAFEYLATQAIADYLASECNLDGIIFPSVQVGEKDKLNVVLFHHAAAVMIPELPEGTEIDARLSDIGEDGPEPGYWIWERIPAEVKEPAPKMVGRLRVLSPSLEIEKTDVRQPSLQVDLAQIAVHHINAVEFTYDSYKVHRHSSTESASAPVF